MIPRYYLNDYFTLVDSPIVKEREYMKTDIREYQNKYIMEIDLPGLKKEDMRGDIKYELDMIYDLIDIASENIEKANGYLARIYNDGNDGEVEEWTRINVLQNWKKNSH